MTSIGNGIVLAIMFIVVATETNKGLTSRLAGSVQTARSSDTWASWGQALGRFTLVVSALALSVVEGAKFLVEAKTPIPDFVVSFFACLLVWALVGRATLVFFRAIDGKKPIGKSKTIDDDKT